MVVCQIWSWGKFQSTLPARGATNGCLSNLVMGKISIHAPRTGSDLEVLFAEFV